MSKPTSNNKVNRAKLADPDYNGDDYEVDDRLNNGPVMQRSCTDVLCSVYAFKNGDSKKLFAPLDADGNFCGLTEGYEDYKLLYFQDLTESNWLPYSVCVSECPLKGDKIDCKTTKEVQDCNDQIFQYNSINLFNKICLPDYNSLPQQFQDRYNNVIGDIGIDDLAQSIQDVTYSWPAFAICFFSCMIVTFIYTFLLRHFAEILSWVSIILGFFGIVGLGYLIYKYGLDKYDDHSTTKEFLKITAYVVWGLSGIYLLIVLCLFNNKLINLNIQEIVGIFKVYQDSSCCVKNFSSICEQKSAHNCYSLPLSDIHVFLYYSMVGHSFESIQCWNDTLRYFIIYAIFAFLWMSALIITCTQYILTVTVCIWYFTSNSDQRGKTSLGTGIKWIFRYNFGSLAFGSFLLALIWFIILVFEYLQKKLDQGSKIAGSPTCCAKFIINFCRCCLVTLNLNQEIQKTYLTLIFLTFYECCHRFIKFLNKNAYVQIALHGKNFCSSAINGFMLVMKNKGTFFITEGLGGIFVFLGKVLISVANTLVGPLAPLAIILLISYVTASIFMSIFSVASISILQCFLTDVELAQKDHKNAGNLEVGGESNIDGKHRPKELDALVIAIRKQKQ